MFMERFTISFNQTVENIVKYESTYYAGIIPWDRKKDFYFECGGICYCYSSWENYTSCGEALHEISRDSFEKGIRDLIAAIPDGKKDDGKRIHLLEKQETGVFAMTIPVDVCFLKQESPLKAVYDKGKAKAKAAAKAIRLKEERAQKAANKKYAQKCGKLARKYGLDFGDVLALGTDETTLKNYILALTEARDIIRQMDRKEKDALRHELYECGRARRRAAMEYLGIETLADPNRLTLQELCDVF